MDEHRGIMSYACPSCQAKVIWHLSEARDGTDTEGDTGDNQGPLRVSVVVERWLARHRKFVSITLILVVQPDKAIRVLHASLYPPPPDHEPTLAEVVAQTPTMMGEAAGEVAADLIGLIVPAGACSLCAEFTKALVGALVAILLQPIVAPIVLFLDCVSAISALLPAGDVNLVGLSLMKRWTGEVLEEALGPHLERWEQVFTLCADAGLTQLAVQPVEREAPHPPRQIAAQANTAAVRLEELFESLDPALRPDVGQRPVSPADTAAVRLEEQFESLDPALRPDVDRIGCPTVDQALEVEGTGTPESEVILPYEDEPLERIDEVPASTPWIERQWDLDRPIKVQGSHEPNIGRAGGIAPGSRL
jgi:hypothetical protein